MTGNNPPSLNLLRARKSCCNGWATNRFSCSVLSPQDLVLIFLDTCDKRILTLPVPMTSV